MDDVGRSASDERGEARHRHEIVAPGIAVDRRRLDAERQAAADARERRFDPRAAAVRIEEHADVMAARALFGGEIDDMAKQPAEGGAKDVNDAKFRRLRLGRRHR